MVWVGVVIVAYYVVHKPFASASVLAVGEAAAGLIGAGLVVALGAGIGLLILQWLDLAPAERLVWATALGLGLVSLAGLALATVGLLRSWLLWLLTATGVVATGKLLRQALRAAWADPSWWPRWRFEKLLAGYCGLTLVAALAWALAPPTAWDGLVYHLTGPRLYLAAGRIGHPLDLPYLGFPQLVEMLFAWGMGLAGERAAAMVHWFYGLMATLSLVTAGRRWLGDVGGWLAAAVLLSAPSIAMLAGWPYVDLALLLYATLAFLSLAHFCAGGPQSRRWLFLSGVFTGLALSTKYTALALLPALGSALLAARLLNLGPRIRNLRPAICSLLLLCGVALAVWSPWLLKNLLLTGNPTYPFFFDGVYWDDWRAWWYDRPGTGLAHTAPWRLLAAPWDVAVWGVGGAAGYSATIGPLFLALFPLLFLVWRRPPANRRRWLAVGLVCCGVLYGFWLWGVARSALLLQTRLLFPAFGLLALVVSAAVAGLRVLPRRPIDVGWIVRATILLVLLLNLIETGLGWVREGPQRVLLGFERQEEYLARQLGWYYPAIQAVNALPGDPTVLFLWEPRTYYCTVVECLPDALLDRWLHTTHLYGHDAKAITDAWRTEGVTHVLLYRTGYQAIVDAGFDPVTASDRATLARLLTEDMVRMEDFGGSYELYAFPEESRP